MNMTLIQTCLNYHTPVLLHEVTDGLNLQENDICVDATVGGGGHALEICKKLKNGKLIAIDKDHEAIIESKKKLAEWKNITFINEDFKKLNTILVQNNINKVDKILIDLGVSSYQLNNPERGFSYKTDGPLDMRMDASYNFSAKDLINTYSEDQLTQVFQKYGEIKNAKFFSKKIVKVRKIKPISTTFELKKILEIPITSSKSNINIKRKHPAKQIFQAIRIEVNRELKFLENILEEMVLRLNSKGRIAIITFHSLEDRIVKKKFTELAKICMCPSWFPVCRCDKISFGRIVNSKPILPSKIELANNKRSKSAKLRIFEKF